MSETGSSRTQIRPLPLEFAADGSRTVSIGPAGGSSLLRHAAISTDAPLAPHLDEQPTVISKNPLAPPAVHFGSLNPTELGRVLQGERLGHFDLQEFIGGGGMGAVFRALDTMLNRIVAVKVLSQDQASDEEALKRFKNEAQSAARLDHINISRVYYVGEDRGLHYIVFEYIDGINLRDLVLKQGPLAIEDAISFTLQIADALDHASNRDVVHRDIKPSNVLITADGKAKVVDMGLARLHQIAQPDNDLTASGVTLGTFDYISPEQARDPRAADVRSDLYSLGCTLYFLLTGRPPFPEGTVLQKLLQHQGDEPPDPRTLREELPDELVEIVRKLMAKNPAARYQSPAELAAVLLELSADIGVDPYGGESAARAELEARLQPNWQRHLPWAVPLALLLVAMGVLNLVWSSSEAETDTLPPLSISKLTLPPPHHELEPSTVRPKIAPEVAPLPPASVTPAPNDSAGTKPVTPDEPPSEASLDRAPGSETLSSLSLRNQVLGGAGLGPPESHAALTPLLPSSAILGQHTLTDPGLLSRATGIVVPAETIAPSTPRKGILTVAGADGEPGTFASVRAACAAAQNNDVIELKFNGRLEEKPFALKNLKVKIRAAEGFQPILAFRPPGDSATFPQSMITVAGGQLSIANVALELDLSPDAIAESWTLFELQRADAVRLDGCWLTIRNATALGTAYHRGVSFFQLTPAPGTESMMLTPGAPPAPTVSLELKNCIARGEANFLSSSQPQPIHLQWDNGLLATSEHLWTSDGGEHPARGNALIQLELRHVTALTRSGLCQFSNSADAPYQLETQIHCEDSILIGGESAALIEQAGVDRVQDFQQRLNWDASRNFYEDYGVFWRVRGGDSNDMPLQWNFQEWREHWGGDHENALGRAGVVWMQPPDNARAPHAIVPADYTVSGAEDNPAHSSASDGRNVGAMLDQLPPAPPAPAAMPVKPAKAE